MQEHKCEAEMTVQYTAFKAFPYGQTNEWCSSILTGQSSDYNWCSLLRICVTALLGLTNTQNSEKVQGTS